MTRYRNPETGVVINVPEDRATTHAQGFEPVGEGAQGDKSNEGEQVERPRRGRPPKSRIEAEQTTGDAT